MKGTEQVIWKVLMARHQGKRAKLLAEIMKQKEKWSGYARYGKF